MLTNEQIQNLNDLMLGLGQPIDKDEVGYNVPDFSRMNGLGYIPSEKYTPLMCFAMLDTLRHYENTQLKSMKDDIEETYAYYDRTVSLKEKKLYTENHLYFKGANLDYLPSDIREELLHKDKLPITYVKTYTSKNMEDYLVLVFENSRKANSFKNQIQTEDNENGNPKRCYFRNIGDFYNPEFQFYIKPELLPEFIKVMDYKFYPDEALEKILVEMDLGSFKIEHKDIPVEVLNYNKDTDEYELYTDAYVADLKDFVNKNKPLTHWNKNDNGKFSLIVASECMNEYLSIMENPKFHFDLKALKDLYKENEKNKENNKTDYILADFSEFYRLDGEPGGLLVLPRNAELLKLIQNMGYFKNFPSMSGNISIELTEKEFINLGSILEQLSNDFNMPIKMSNDLLSICESIKNKYKNPYPMIDARTLDLPFTPRDYQLEDIQAIGSKTRALIGHDMGCGKTFMATVVGTSIKEPKLVVVPESLRLNWEKEIKRITPEADVKVLYSKDKFELGKDWTIVGYSTASKFEKELDNANINCIFVDEAHKCKAVNNSGNPSSARAKAVMKLAEKAKYCYLLTGTPIPTRNKDLYNILKMLKVQDIDFKEKYAFFNYGKEFCNGQYNGFGWDFDGNSNAEELHKILAPNMVRRLKKDVLPDLVKQRTFIPVKAMNSEVRDIEKRMEELTDNDTFMGLAMTGRRLMSNNKLNDCIELANTMLEAEESVVIVSEFVETINKLKEIYKDDCCTIVGGMSDIAKEKAKMAFQNGEKKICAVNTVAGGVGLTLTKASNMIICDFNWTPANMIQVEDRICRIGQENPCNIYYLYGDDCILDKYFVDMITDKNGNIDLVVDQIDNQMDLKDTRSNNTSFLDYLKDRLHFKIPCNITPVNKGDEAKITKLSKLNHIETFEEDVLKYTKSVKSDKTLADWQRLIDLRREELLSYEQNKSNQDMIR